MYEKNGEKYFIVDAHIALWDARPENQRNIHGKQFIDCFYDYHRNLSPEEQVWDYDTYCYYGPDRLMQDLFVDGPADHAIFQATILKDFYVKIDVQSVSGRHFLFGTHPERDGVEATD